MMESNGDDDREAVDSEPSALKSLFSEQWRDIFEIYISKDLNEIDLKQLYSSFKDARLAIIRANIALKTEFKIVELTSIAELEVAWDNYRWDEDEDEGTQEYFCSEVALMNKLEYLVWLREVKNCDWDSLTIIAAAEKGNLAMVKYCFENGCPMDEDACWCAAQYGHLDVLKYLHENDCPWDSDTCRSAHEYNRIDCLNYLIEQRCPGWERFDSTHVDYDPY